MKSLELVVKSFKTSHNESQEDCYGLWRRSCLNSFPVLSKSCTCFFWPARSYVTNPSCSRVHMSPPHLVELDMLLLVWPAAPHAKHESCVQLLGQSSFKRYVLIQLLLPSLITRSFPPLEEASGHQFAFCWWCKSLNHMYLHIVDYEVLVNLVSILSSSACKSLTLQIQSGHLSHLFFHTGKDWIDLAHWAAYLCRHF
jgi:hypothetical protein